MIATWGQLTLILALALAVVQGVWPLWAAQHGAQPARGVVLAPVLVGAQFAVTTLALALLVVGFARNDFGLAYVANNSNSLLPLHYRLAGTWGGHEGSLLLWVWLLGVWSLAVALKSRASLPPATLARVLGVLGLLSAGFLGFTLFTSNPFESQSPVPADGRDLNPLLQDLGMIFHPPLLYLGYVGFAVAFAFAVAALIEGRLDAAWAKWSRPWTLLAWVFLTLGITLGSFWAYYELGWGGWWFWDAVENASLMPWLVGCALLHALAVAEKRGSFKNWAVLLAILAFSLSLLGTFLVRSGVLSSVHAFASDPRRGLYILIFLVLVIGSSLTLYAWRAGAVGLGAPFALFSRESLLLLGNVLLLVSTGSILLGTLYPLAIDALGLGKISVGPPYFNAVFVPLMLPVLALLGLGPFLAWKQAAPSRVWAEVRAVAVVTGLIGLGGALAAQTSVQTSTSALLGLWALLATLHHVVQRLRVPGAPWRGAELRQRARSLPRGFWGMVLAHIGVAVFVLAVTVVGSFEAVQDARIRVGGHVLLGDYRFDFVALQKRQGPNYLAGQATFEVTRQGQPVATLHPEKRFYTVQRMPMTEAAIDRGLTRDLYVSLGEAQAEDGSWGVRVQLKPGMNWLWAGCLLMALGGLLAATDPRYRRRNVSVTQAQTPTHPLIPGASPVTATSTL